MREKVAESDLQLEREEERVMLRNQMKDIREKAEELELVEREKVRDRDRERVPEPEVDEVRRTGYRGPCNCSKIIMSSNNPTTLSKHGAELGQYNLIGSLNERPVYRHNSREYYLFYQPQSGGNWLVNTKPGLLYGGIQNSKVSLSDHIGHRVVFVWI